MASGLKHLCSTSESDGTCSSSTGMSMATRAGQISRNTACGEEDRTVEGSKDAHSSVVRCNECHRSGEQIHSSRNTARLGQEQWKAPEMADYSEVDGKRQQGRGLWFCSWDEGGMGKRSMVL